MQQGLGREGLSNPLKAVLQLVPPTRGEYSRQCSTCKSEKTNTGKHSILPNGLIYFTKTQNQKHKRRKNENLQLSSFAHICGVFDHFVFKATDENLVYHDTVAGIRAGWVCHVLTLVLFVIPWYVMCDIEMITAVPQFSVLVL